MKNIDEFVDNLEKRVEGIVKGILHGQEINREKVKKSVKKEVVALCKEYYKKGFADAGFEIHEDTSIYDDPDYQEDLERNLEETFKE